MHGWLATMEALTCIGFTECEVGKIANKLGWSEEFSEMEDLYVLSVIDRAIYQFLVAVSTMRKEHIVGLPATVEGGSRGQQWVGYLEYTFAESLRLASKRPHYGFKESAVMENYVNAGIAWQRKRAPPPPPTPKVIDPKVDKPPAGGGKNPKEQLFCIANIAQVLGVEGQVCKRGADCYFSHKFDRKAKTDAQWIEFVNASKVRSESLKRKLAQAFGVK